MKSHINCIHSFTKTFLSNEYRSKQICLLGQYANKGLTIDVEQEIAFGEVSFLFNRGFNHWYQAPFIRCRIHFLSDSIGNPIWSFLLFTRCVINFRFLFTRLRSSLHPHMLTAMPFHLRIACSWEGKRFETVWIWHPVNGALMLQLELILFGKGFLI